MTIMNKFLQGMLTTISDYCKQQTQKEWSFDLTSCTEQDLRTAIEAATTVHKDRKKVLTYIANNFISLREQSIKIDPNSTDTSLTENLAATVISFQILMRSIESKTSISANGFELTDVGLSRAGYMGLSTSLRYSGQCQGKIIPL